uniref:J domain-containing protein n=1 Tax=Acrobeloides nanus TaxID=290746 RepID=A0A914BUQ9_9BILA
MSFKKDCDEIYGTTDLYHILQLDRKAKVTAAQIKKAYYKQSIIWHPDRFPSNQDEELKTNATRRFQIISKAYMVLSDPEKRKVYDDTGLIEDEAVFDENMDWSVYWRHMFKKVTPEDIEAFLAKYTGSKEQVADVKLNYEKFKGNLNKILECTIGGDNEDQIRLIIDDLIATGEVQAYEKYTKEPPAAREKRRKKAEKEANEVDKMLVKKKQNGADFDLAEAIALRHEQRAAQADKFFDNLLTKYGNKEKKSQKNGAKGRKRKASSPIEFAEEEDEIEITIEEGNKQDVENGEPTTSNRTRGRKHSKVMKTDHASTRYSRRQRDK